MITDPLPILKVRVNEKADAYFLLDTGAPTASLDPAFASELGIKSRRGRHRDVPRRQDSNDQTRHALLVDTRVGDGPESARHALSYPGIQTR